MLDRKSIILKAYKDCLEECFIRAQPSVHFDDVCNEENFFEHYYLSKEEFKYVVDKYIKAYHIDSDWNFYSDTIIQYLKTGGYKPGKGYDKHPAFIEYCKEFLSEDQLTKVSNILFTMLEDCQQTHKFDSEEKQFTFSTYLGPSPNSNKEAVIEYWKSKGVDLVIEDRNPALFWEQDYYGDEFEEIMVDEYGENWREIRNQEWLKN